MLKDYLHKIFEMRTSRFGDKFFRKKLLSTSSKNTAERLFRPLLIVLNAALNTQAKNRPGSPGVDRKVSMTNKGKSFCIFFK